jgi:hypothetical protein
VPSATKQPRDWRTRSDPFTTVWSSEIEPLLQRDTKGVLEAKWVLAELCLRHPSRFHPRLARAAWLGARGAFRASARARARGRDRIHPRHGPRGHDRYTENEPQRGAAGKSLVSPSGLRDACMMAGQRNWIVGGAQQVFQPLVDLHEQGYATS